MTNASKTSQDLCPCGSGRGYPACCGPCIDGTVLPSTAEQLMRSRYSAYARGKTDYLQDSWHPTTRRQDLAADPPVRWIGLEILATEAGGPDDQRGIVEFVARYQLNGRTHRLQERSRFKRYQGRWFYVDGDVS